MIIRQAGLEDVDRIVELGVAFLSSSSYTTHIGTIDPARLEATVRQVLEHGVIFLADVDVPVDLEGLTLTDRTSVGMLAVYVAEHPLTGQRYADELAWFVEPAHRKGTTGYRLLCAAVEWARQNGLSVLKMVAPADSPDVGTFYVRRGFTLIESVYQKTL